MREERIVIVDNTEHVVVISDETEALLAAKAAGRAIIGLWHRENAGDVGSVDAGSENAADVGSDLSAARYLIESPDDLSLCFLERVVQRHLGLPWVIGETERLLIREFQLADAREIPREDTDTEADQIFYMPERLADYIRCQYGFYEYGIWALVDRESGKIIGKAGLSPLDEKCQWEEGFCFELGYHIFQPYRRKGYATEACRRILAIAREEWENCRIYAKIDASNEASIRVIQSCGFKLLSQTCNGAMQYSYPDAPC